MTDRDRDPDDEVASTRTGEPSMSTDSGAPPPPAGEPWPVVESVTENETGWYTGGYDLVEQPDGSRKRYYWAELDPAVVVVAVADGSVVFVEQYRPTIRRWQLELPAGIVEDDESFSTAAARELREETGFDPAGVSILQTTWVATGVLRHRRAIAFAEGLEPVRRHLDENEFLRVRPVPIEQAMAVARREPANEATLEGLLVARAEGLV